MFVQGFPGAETSRFGVSEEAVERLEIIGRSPVMRALYRDIETVGQSDAAVLIEGETGVGKNLVARALHQIGPRARKPFATLNAANLPEELFESELFGHVRGAFSGAYGDHRGLARAADGGTLLIDAIAELSLGTQAKLLGFLDRQEVRPVGGPGTTPVDLRLICTTNRDLRRLVENGRFRRDLYYRVRGIAIRLPPLRDRLDDLPLLVEHFIERFNRRYDKSIPGIDSAAAERLRGHAWEGNVRELENEVERAVVLTADGTEIRSEVFSFGRDDYEHLAVPAAALEASRAIGGNNDDAAGGSVLGVSRRAAERVVIAEALERNGWNVSAAARELGISRVGLTRKLKRLGMRRPGT